MERETYIYKVQNILNSKCYIGVTDDPGRREADHRNRNTNLKYKESKILYRAIEKYGPDNFSFEIVYCSKDYAHTRDVMESHFIERYKAWAGYGTGYNATKGGEGTVGYRFPKEMIESIRAERKARFQNPEYMAKYKGRKHSEEHKRKIGKSIKATWDLQGHNLKGTRRSEESKRKTSRTLKDIGHGFTKEALDNQIRACAKRWSVTFPDEHIEEVLNISEFCRKHNLDSSNMRGVAKGRNSNHKGFKCKLLEK